MKNLLFYKITSFSCFVLIVSCFFVLTSLQASAEIKHFTSNKNLVYSGASFLPEAAGDRVGSSMSIVGDLNGDGIDDLVVGAGGNGDGGVDAGKIYIFFGKTTGWSMDTNVSNADASFIGENPEDYLGSSITGIGIAGVGDVNGDGYDDFIVGAHGNQEGGFGAGQTYLILGKANGWAKDVDISNANASFIGEDSNDWSGIAVSGAGDVNNDGYDDFLIGAYGDEDGGGSYAGQAYLILGKSTGWTMDTSLSSSSASFIAEATNNMAGASLSGVGDVNGDNYDDFIISAVRNGQTGTYAGQTYLILGKQTGWAMDTNLSSSSASFIGETSYNFSGCSVSGAGDVNGDGYDDFIIGALTDDNGVEAGETYLILGKQTGWEMDVPLSMVDGSYLGEDESDYLGWYVSGAGDLNSDGYDDFITTSYDDEEGGKGTGQTYIVLGKPSGWSMNTIISSIDGSFIGEYPGDQGGYHPAGVGDLNDDGYDDFLVTSYYNDEGGVDGGQVYLIFGGEDLYQIVNADTSINFVDSNGNTYKSGTENGTTSENLLIRTTVEGYYVSDVVVNFSSGDPDWTTVDFDIDTHNGVSVVSNLSTAEGVVGGVHSLFVPKLSNHGRVMICPEAQTLGDVSVDCENGYILDVTDPNVSIVTLNGKLYWRISGLTGTGGMGLYGEGTMFTLTPSASVLSSTQEVQMSYTSSGGFLNTEKVRITWDNASLGSALLNTCTTPTTDANGASVGGTGTASIIGNNVYEYTFSTTTPASTLTFCVNVTSTSTQGSYAVTLNDDNGIYGVALYYVGGDNQVNILANVAPTLSFNIVDVDDTTDKNDCNFGSVTTQTLVPNYDSIIDSGRGECGYGLAVGTNAVDGFSTYIIADGSLRNSNANILDITTGSTFTTGTEAYGLVNVTVGQTGRSTTTGLYTESFTRVSPFTETTSGMRIPTSTSELYRYDDGVQYVQGTDSLDVTKVIHGIVVGAGTPAGMYQQVVTYTVVPRF